MFDLALEIAALKLETEELGSGDSVELVLLRSS